MYFQTLAEQQFAPQQNLISSALRDYDLIDSLASILDNYLLLGVYNDLEKCAQSRVLYTKKRARFIPDVDDIFFSETPEILSTPTGQKRITDRAAYVRYFELFIKPHALTQQGQTLDGVDAFYARHPLLSHVLQTLSNNFQNNIRLAMERLIADWGDINAVFGNGDFTQLLKIQPTGSDSHKGGKQVLIFEFAVHNASPRKVVYKPSDIETDYRIIGDTQAVQGLGLPAGESLTEITNRQLENENREFIQDEWDPAPADIPRWLERLRLPTYRILPRNPGSQQALQHAQLNIGDSYGYLEFIDHQPQLHSPFSDGEIVKKTHIRHLWESTPAAARQAFDWITDTQDDAIVLYRQWGQLMAMAHVFSITDLHMQNQIVHQKKPTLIDLEVSFNAPDRGVGRSMISGYYQLLNDPEQQNELEFGNLLNDYLPVTLHPHAPHNNHSKNQLYCYNGTAETDADIVTREVEADYRGDLFEGIASVLATYRVPEQNLEIRNWVNQLANVTVRLVPRPTPDFIRTLTDFVTRYSHQTYVPPDNPQWADQLWRWFAGDGDNIKAGLTAWWLLKYQAEDFLQFPGPFFALDNPRHNWRDYVAMDVPAYYRRIGERHLRDSLGRIVRIDNAVRDQYQWLRQNGTEMPDALTMLPRLSAMLNASPVPHVGVTDEDDVNAFPDRITQLNDDFFVHGHYFSRTGIEQAIELLLNLGNMDEHVFTQYVERIIEHSFGQYFVDDTDSDNQPFHILFETLSEDSNESLAD